MNLNSFEMAKMKFRWHECLEFLGLSNSQAMEIAGVSRTDCILNLDFVEFYKLMMAFNISSDQLANGRVCLKTILRQFGGEMAVSERALGNRGSRSEVVLKLCDDYLTEFEAYEVLSRFQLSKKILEHSTGHLSAHLTKALVTKICQKNVGFRWQKKLSRSNCRGYLKGRTGNPKSLVRLVEHGMELIERNLSYGIDKLSHRRMVFSCQTNQKTRDYFGQNVEDIAWLVNIKDFTEAYLSDRCRVRILASTIEGGSRNSFEVLFD